MTAVLAVAIAAMALGTQEARAGCGPEVARSAMTPAVYRSDPGGARLVLTDFDDWHGPFASAGITGLWKFVFTGQGNTGPAAMFNGQQIDAGFVTWHDDGTELMNSGRAPVSGSFCMGVWKRLNPTTYHLNHWALSWVPDYHPGVSTWSLRRMPPHPSVHPLAVGWGSGARERKEEEENRGGEYVKGEARVGLLGPLRGLARWAALPGGIPPRRA